MRKMVVDYLPDNNQKAICQILAAAGGRDPVFECTPDKLPTWTPAFCRQEGTQLVSLSSTDQSKAVAVMGLIARWGLAIVGSSPFVPSMVACSDLLGFTTLEYAYLWDGFGANSFCKVRLPEGTINYAPISRVQELLQDPGTSPAVNFMITQYQDALPSFDPEQMKAACSAKLTYKDMSIVPLRELCGCYVGVPDTPEFSSDEKYVLSQNPQCIPSCLSAAVRYAVNGAPETCQQNVCIVDNINVTGSTTSIAQVCPQCVQKYKCVCYIHINGQSINNDTCNTVYQVSPDGSITDTTHNSAPAIGSGFKQAWESFIRSPAALISLIVVVVLICIIVFSVLITRSIKGRSSKMRTVYQRPLSIAPAKAPETYVIGI